MILFNVYSSVLTEGSVEDWKVVSPNSPRP